MGWLDGYYENKKIIENTIDVAGSGVLYESTITGYDSSGLISGAVLHFAGRDTANDGGGGLFTFDSASIATADDGVVFAPTGGGRLLRDGYHALGFNGRINTKWFGAKGDLSNIDDVPIQAAINAYPGYVIYIPEGNYKTTDEILVSSDYTKLVGDGIGVTIISQYTPNKDTIRFAPTTAGTTSAYLSRPGIEGMSISVASAAYTTGTSGAGVRFTQCDVYSLYKVAVNNAPEGITIEGGQLGSLKSFVIFSPLTPAGSAESALLHFRAAPYGAGLYQKCYTTVIEDFKLSATLLKKSCIRIANADGLLFTGGYVAYGEEDLLRLKNDYDNSYISSVSFINTYFDCVGAGQTPTAINIPADAYTGTMIHTLKVGSGCTIGNGDTSGIVITNPDVNLLSFDGAHFLNFGSWAINSAVGGSTLTLHVANNQFSNVGDVSSGAIRAATGGRSVSIVGNTFNTVDNQCVQIGGTWGNGAVVGNINNSAVPDIVNTATFSTYFNVSGNSSAYPATNPDYSWREIMAANTVKVNNTASAESPIDLALTSNTFLVRGSTGDIAAGTFGTGISFVGSVATPSSYWDGTNFRNSAGVIIDGIYTENDIVDLNLVTPTDGLAGVVENPGDNAAATNTTTYPWGVIGNGTKWDVFGGRSMLARMTVPVKVTRPAVTFAGAYTVSNDGTGKVKIKSAAAGAHGLTGAVAVGASIYVSAGTLAGLHEISSIPVDTTGDEIILTTAFSGTPTVTSIAKDTADAIIVWSFTVPPLRATSMLFMPILGYAATDSVNDKKVHVDYGGTNFRELTLTNTGDLSLTAETVIMNIATNSQVARSPRTNGNDTGAVGAVITGSVNSAIAQTFNARVTFAVPNEVITVLSRVEVIW